MTLRAIAAALIGEFLRAAKTTEELNLREEAILRALDEVYDRRLREIRTEQEMKLKTAMAAATDHDGEEN